jgi:hypothetical protein
MDFINTLNEILAGEKSVPDVPFVVDFNMKKIFIAIAGFLTAAIIFLLVVKATKK